MLYERKNRIPASLLGRSEVGIGVHGRWAECRGKKKTNGIPASPPKEQDPEPDLGYDMRTFVEVMPESVRRALLGLGNRELNEVVEVVMDLGRLPFVRLGSDGPGGKGRRVCLFFLLLLLPPFSLSFLFSLLLPPSPPSFFLRPPSSLSPPFPSFLLLFLPSSPSFSR
jgi:hypothetical protein